MREQRPGAKAKLRFTHVSLGLLLSALGCSLLAPNDDDLYGNQDGGSAGRTGGGGTSGSSSKSSGGTLAASGSAGTANGAGDTGASGSAGASGGDSGISGNAGAAGTPDNPNPLGGASGSGGAGGDSGGGNAPVAGSGGKPTGCAAPSPACTPNMPDVKEKACGNCGTTTQKRTCGADCTWGDWGAWSACSSEGECAPNDTSMTSERCPGACGPRTLTRTCSNTCTWGPYSVTASTCVACTACGEIEFCDEPGAARGTVCLQKHAACNDAEINADCAAILVDLGCSRHEPYVLEHL